MREIVIIGAGQGGYQAALSLRQEGYDGKITLIGDENHLPYQRPPLSKVFLKTGNEEMLWLQKESFYADNDITLLLGQPVERIDRANRYVILADKTVPYDHLILATGSRNFRPNLRGFETAYGLRTLTDARDLRHAAKRSERCAIIGGGFTGLEFATVARRFGCEVSIIEMADRLMARAVSHAVSSRFESKHRALGTRIHLGRIATGVADDGVVLSCGTLVKADFVLLAAGVVPNQELARSAGLEVGNGIHVDAQLLTSDPNISALGDCAALVDKNHDEPIRFETVQAANDHARHVAKRLAKGVSAPFQATPWFWSDQVGWKLQIAGRSTPSDDTMALTDGSVLRFNRHRLSAVETVNAPEIHMRARRLFEECKVISREKAIKQLSAPERAYA